MNLYSGLSGTVDLFGTWYDGTGSPVPSADVNSGMSAGTFDFEHIVSNGSCPNDTAVVSLTVDGACNFLSLEEESLDQVSVYPNPTSDMITVGFNKNTVREITVFNMNGQQLKSAEISADQHYVEISLGDFQDGMYLIRLVGPNASKVVRITKQ